MKNYIKFLKNVKRADYDYETINNKVIMNQYKLNEWTLIEYLLARKFNAIDIAEAIKIPQSEKLKKLEKLFPELIKIADNGFI